MAISSSWSLSIATPRESVVTGQKMGNCRDFSWGQEGYSLQHPYLLCFPLLNRWPAGVACGGSLGVHGGLASERAGPVGSVGSGV